MGDLYKKCSYCLCIKIFMTFTLEETNVNRVFTKNKLNTRTIDTKLIHNINLEKVYQIIFEIL